MISAEAPESSDEALVLQCQAGSHEAFEILVTRFEARIYHFLRGLVRNDHDAEDITQVAFVKAWRNIQTFHSPGAFSAWLFLIAKRSALNHLRTHRLSEMVAEDEFGLEGAVDFNDPSRALTQKDDSGALWALARQLKPNQYEALWLRYGEGFSIAETAQIMETNQIRVKVWLHRGRAHLAKLLGQREKRKMPSTRLTGNASTAPAGID